MVSRLPKALHLVGGLPLVTYALELAKRCGDISPVLVVGHRSQAVGQVAGDGVTLVVQDEQLGTGHALLQASDILRANADLVLVWAADMPLLSEETLNKVVVCQRNNVGPLSMVTIVSDESRGFGRVLRDEDGVVLSVVEENHLTKAQLKIRELNVGVYCFDAEWLWSELPLIAPSNEGEYYLTDLIDYASRQGHTIGTIMITNESEAIGVNNRIHLAQAEQAMRQRVNFDLMERGVTITNPDTVYIDSGVSIGQDTIILPNTHIVGASTVGEECIIGPNSIVRDTTIGSGCKVECSMLDQAVLGDDVHIGPFGHLRPGAHLDEGVHVGNFGEVKNSYLGPGVKMGHFCYVGDASVGARTNIGAGTITCNLGIDNKKYRTEIGKDSFIGSDSLLVAPIIIGDRGHTGAGSVVTKDVPDDSLAVGVPARVIKLEEPPTDE